MTAPALHKQSMIPKADLVDLKWHLDVKNIVMDPPDWYALPLEELAILLRIWGLPRTWWKGDQETRKPSGLSVKDDVDLKGMAEAARVAAFERPLDCEGLTGEAWADRVFRQHVWSHIGL